MSDAKDRFFASEAVQRLKDDSIKRAAPKWAKLPDGFRRFLCRQAGVDTGIADKHLGEIAVEDAKRLVAAATAVRNLCDDAYIPLMTVSVSRPKPRGGLIL